MIRISKQSTRRMVSPRKINKTIYAKTGPKKSFPINGYKVKINSFKDEVFKFVSID